MSDFQYDPHVWLKKPGPKIEFLPPGGVKEVYHAQGDGWEVWGELPGTVILKAHVTFSVENLGILIQNLQLASDAIKFYKPKGTQLQFEKIKTISQAMADSNYWAQATQSPQPAMQALVNDLVNQSLSLAQAAQVAPLALALGDDSLDPEAPKEDDY